MKNGVVGNEVMVGIDPRQQSLPALAWAVEEAAYRGRACVWSWPYRLYQAAST